MKTDSKKDITVVMSGFTVIGLMLIFTMINNFKVIDLCYFGVVIFFAVKYLIISRD